MIAEIKGKISSTNANLTERTEDELTGNVFGNLRYISFNNGLKKILSNGIYPKNIAEKIEKINHDFWDQCINFWPYHKEGEIDVKIDFSEMIIGIEVKYLSGLSSDDAIGYDIVEIDTITNNCENQINELSINQLSRESRMLDDWGKNKEKILILLWDYQKCHGVYNNITSRKGIIQNDIAFCYITWQDFLKELKALKPENNFEKIIINDLIDLLTKKGFDTFQGFEVTQEIFLDQNWLFAKGNLPQKCEYLEFSSQIEVKPKLLWYFENI